jgi:hypothetical protein
MERHRREIVLRIPYGFAIGAIAGSLVIALALLAMPQSRAQKAQDSYDSKFNIAEETAGVGITTSADGKYVYIVGPRGVLVSEDHGRTGSWVQTVRLK